MEIKESVSLENLGYGDAIVLFDADFKKLVANVIDPNTNGGKRKITLTVEVAPNDARDRCEVTVSTALKLAGTKPVKTAIHMVKDGGDLYVAEEKRQEPLPLG